MVYDVFQRRIYRLRARMEITPDTARFLLMLVNGLTLNVGAPDFDATLTQVQSARSELQAILGATPPPKQ